MTIWYSHRTTNDEDFYPQFNVIKFMYDADQKNLYMTCFEKDEIKRYIYADVRYIRSEVV